MTNPRDDQFFTIEEVVRALRSPARADELQDEDEVIAAMAAVLDRPKELTSVTTTRSRPFKVAVIAGVAVVSLAGVAAATGVLPDRAPEPPPGPTIVTSTDADASVAAEASTSVVSVPETSVGDRTTTAEAESTQGSRTTTTDAPASAAAAGRGIDPARCPRNVDNHGDFVSEVAQAVPPGPNHGSIVSEAAQSDCGKPDAAQAGSQHRRDEPPAAAKGNGNAAGNGDASANGNGNGNASANGNGNGNGHSNGNANGSGGGNGKSNGNGGGNGHP